MKIGLIEAVWEGTPFEGRGGAEIAREIGFDSMDVVGDPLSMSDAEYTATVKDVLAWPLPVTGAVCCALGIADFNESVQQFHVERAKRHVKFAADVGASNLLMVIGDYIWRNEVFSGPDQWGWAVKNVKAIAKYAGSLDIDLALEVEAFEWSIINSIGEASRFLMDVGEEALKANVDLNHLWTLKSDVAELQGLSGRIVHSHISDCDGVVYKNYPPGRMNAPLRRYMKGLHASGFDGTVAVELQPPPETEDPVGWVTEGYVETKKIMDECGVSRG